MPETEALLRLDHVNASYGKIHVLKGVNLEVMVGEIVTLIGANGAGKSTVLRTIAGLLKPTAGWITLKQERINHLEAYEIPQRGIALAPEGRRIFAKLTVKENLEMGAYIQSDQKLVDNDMAWVFELFPRLAQRVKQTAGTLSGGEQQMLAIGRALMSRPELLLLDEPSMGLSPILAESIFEIIRYINKSSNVSILLVEQNAHAALETAQRGYVMQTGEIALTDSAAELRQNEMVRKLYLGEE